MLKDLLHTRSTTPDCVCEHTYAAHEHYRPGKDCGFATCRCEHFRVSRVLLAS
jgi:hypothetical protein